MSHILLPEDLTRVVNRIPSSVKAAFQKETKFPKIIAGGFIRATVAREEISDLDIFVPTLGQAKDLAFAIQRGQQNPNRELKQTSTENAITIKGLPVVVQLIHKVPFHNWSDVIGGFDYTICKAAVIVTDHGNWGSAVDPRFYADLAARRLVYSRSSTPGGSLVRLLKFTRRGYSIDAENLAALMEAMHSAMNEDGNGIDAIDLIRKVPLSS